MIQLSRSAKALLFRTVLSLSILAAIAVFFWPSPDIRHGPPLTTEYDDYDNYKGHITPKPKLDKPVSLALPSPPAPSSSPTPVTDAKKPVAETHHKPSGDVRCAAFPDPGNVVVVVKTGATEAYSKLPMQLMTSLQCAKNVLLFSDLEQRIGDYKLHDALSSIPQEVLEANSDFDVYRKQKELFANGQRLDMVKDMLDSRFPDSVAAWTLDKYKFLHVVEKAWTMQPDKDWYVFIEADTYLVWSNLLQWLQRLDPKEKSFFGSQVPLNKLYFAHGGSGFILSGPALREFAVVHNGTAAAWNQKMHEECCGDYALAVVLKEMDIILQGAWPMINGEKPSTLAFGPTQWCQPVITMHHVDSEEMNDIWLFEQQRKDPKEVITFSELFQYYTRPPLPPMRDDWDNLAGDEAIAFEPPSADACRETCVSKTECFQYTFDGKICKIGKSMQLGHMQAPDEEKRWRSGWETERISQWTAEHTCSSAEWVEAKEQRFDDA